jgi:hypothetical protein
MKPNPLSLFASILAASLLTTANVEAQKPSFQDMARAQVAAESSKNQLATLNVEPGTFEEVIPKLQRELEDAGLQRLNIIYGNPNMARAHRVPEMSLRNVSGPDALRLIATAAGCEAEPINGEDLRIIGYRVFAVARPSIDLLGMDAGGMSAAGFGGGAASGMSGYGEAYGSSGGADYGVVSQPGGARAGGRRMGGGFGPGRTDPGVNVYTAYQPGQEKSEEGTTAVYPLAAITGSLPVADVEATLRDAFRLDGLDSKKLQLAFHEKTGVLIVKGGDAVHQLVNEVLESLNQNQTAKGDSQAEITINRLESALTDQARAKERLQRQLDENEAMLRDLDRENARLRAVAKEQ